MKRSMLALASSLFLPSFLALLAAGIVVTGVVVAPAARAGEGLSNIFHDVEEVHVVNVDVVVTDADGQPVTDLTAEDFQLFEDGRPVEISNFFAVAEGRVRPPELPGGGEEVEKVAVEIPETAEATSEPASEPAPSPELHLVVYVDNVHIRPAHRNRMLNRLQDYLTRHWRPGMSVMLVSNERELEVRQPFTGQREDVFAALEELERTGSRGSRLDQDREALLAAIGQVRVDAGSGLYETKVGLFGADRQVGQGDEEEQRAAPTGSMTQGEVTAMVQAHAHSLMPQLMAYAQARNDEVLASLRVLDRLVDMLAGLPGRKAVLHVSDGLSVNPAEAVFEAYQRMFEVLPQGPAMTDLADEIPRYNLIAAFRKLTEAANAGRVSLYTLDASPPEAVSRGGAENANEIRSLGFSSTEERNQQDSLVLMAEETGGRSSLSNVTLEATVRGLFDDFETYYSVGYQADREPGRVRRIEVRLAEPRPGLTVRHRSRLRDATPEERMVERTLAALHLGRFHNPLEIRIEAQEAEPAKEGNFLVPVVVRIPLRKLVLIPGEKTHQAQVSMYVAVADERGRTSEVIRQICPIRVPNSELLVALGDYAGCGVRLLMRPGAQRVAIGVRDELSRRDATTQLELTVGAERKEQAGSAGDRDNRGVDETRSLR